MHEEVLILSSVNRKSTRVVYTAMKPVETVYYKSRTPKKRMWIDPLIAIQNAAIGKDCAALSMFRDAMASTGKLQPLLMLSCNVRIATAFLLENNAAVLRHNSDLAINEAFQRSMTAHNTPNQQKAMLDLQYVLAEQRLKNQLHESECV